MEFKLVIAISIFLFEKIWIDGKIDPIHYFNKNSKTIVDDTISINRSQ